MATIKITNMEEKRNFILNDLAINRSGFDNNLNIYRGILSNLNYNHHQPNIGKGFYHLK